MFKLSTLTPIAAVLAVAGFSHAAETPFEAKPVTTATMPADAGKEGKCGAMKEGKCGAVKVKEEGKAMKEGKCGEGKCGAKKKAAEAAAAKEAADKK